MEEIMERQLLNRGQRLQQFLQLRKLSRVVCFAGLVYTNFHLNSDKNVLKKFKKSFLVSSVCDY